MKYEIAQWRASCGVIGSRPASFHALFARAAKTGRSFMYDDLGLTLILLDAIKAQAIEMREAIGAGERAATSGDRAA